MQFTDYTAQGEHRHASNIKVSSAKYNLPTSIKIHAYNKTICKKSQAEL